MLVYFLYINHNFDQDTEKPGVEVGTGPNRKIKDELFFSAKWMRHSQMVHIYAEQCI